MQLTLILYKRSKGDCSMLKKSEESGKVRQVTVLPLTEEKEYQISATTKFNIYKNIKYINTFPYQNQHIVIRPSTHSTYPSSTTQRLLQHTRIIPGKNRKAVKKKI